VLRTGCFDHTQKSFDATTDEGQAEMKKYALERYNKALDARGEILVSGSDDFTMYMWQPKKQTKSLARMTGHQALIIQVAFSPDGFYFVSASFDKCIKLWEGKTGKYLSAFRGHVNPVY
jgi:ribosome assembly protein 4